MKSGSSRSSCEIAGLGPDPNFFQQVLDTNFVATAEDGGPFLAKEKVVAADQRGDGLKFTGVEMKDLQVLEYRDEAVVTCSGSFETRYSRPSWRLESIISTTKTVK